MRNGRYWRHSSRHAVRRTRRRITTCAAASRRSSGGTIAVRSGARSRLGWACGGWGRADLQSLVAAGRLGAAAGVGAAAWRGRGWDGVPRRHQHPSTPQARRCGEKGGSSAERDEREALGRSRGGYGTKACVIADASGRAIGFDLAPGQAHELPLAPLLLTLLSIIPGWIGADRGYASHAFRDLICDLGARPTIPAKRNDADGACPPWI